MEGHSVVNRIQLISGGEPFTPLKESLKRRRPTGLFVAVLLQSISIIRGLERISQACDKHNVWTRCPSDPRSTYLKENLV